MQYFNSLVVDQWIVKLNIGKLKLIGFNFFATSKFSSLLWC